MTDRPPLQRGIRFTPEALANMRQRYVQTDESTQSIADSFGINRNTVTEQAKRFGWGMRRDRPRGLPTSLPTPVDGRSEEASATEAAATDDVTAANLAALPLAQRLEQAVVRELAKVERRRNDSGGPMRPSEAERVARTLSTLTQTLFRVRALRDPGAVIDDHDDLPAGADDFRRELARRIDAFVASRTDGRLAAAGEPAGADPPAA